METISELSYVLRKYVLVERNTILTFLFMFLKKMHGWTFSNQMNHCE